MLKKYYLVWVLAACIGAACGLWFASVRMPAAFGAEHAAASTAKGGSGGVTAGRFVKLAADRVIVHATAAADNIVGICEITADANAITRYAEPGSISTVSSGAVIAAGDLLTADANGCAVPISPAAAIPGRVGGLALSPDAAGTASVRCAVTGSYMHPHRQGTYSAPAGTLAMPIDVAFINKTTHSGAEALTLADGSPAQVLTIYVGSAGGGTSTLTPTTKSGFTTIGFKVKGDTASLRWVDPNVGWTIQGIVNGSAGYPVIGFP